MISYALSRNQENRESRTEAYAKNINIDASEGMHLLNCQFTLRKHDRPMRESTSFKSALRISISSRKILASSWKLAREIAQFEQRLRELVSRCWENRDARFSPKISRSYTIPRKACREVRTALRLRPSSNVWVSACQPRLLKKENIVALCTIPANYHLSASQSVVKDELLRSFFRYTSRVKWSDIVRSFDNSHAIFYARTVS